MFYIFLQCYGSLFGVVVFLPVEIAKQENVYIVVLCFLFRMLQLCTVYEANNSLTSKLIRDYCPGMTGCYPLCETARNFGELSDFIFIISLTIYEAKVN